jgi:hypothetical protein
MTHQTRDIHDIHEELTRTHTHRERYERTERGTSWQKDHVTLVPALIDQLASASNTQDGANGAGGYKSRPAAWLEPLDTLAAIDKEASRWVRDLGHDDPTDTKACVSKLHGLHASADDTTQKAIERDMRRWWNQARVIAGWDSAAWRPDNTCPVCAERRTLRVKLNDAIAFCTDCRETWAPETIGLLAEHIRSENTEDEGAA